jgi:hypothetical protein
MDYVGMVFGYDVPVTFIAEGNCKGASIHVSGYFQPGPDDDEDDEDDDDEDDDGKYTENLIIAFSFSYYLIN